MQKCQYCGFGIKPEDAFCGHCGKKISVKAKPTEKKQKPLKKHPIILQSKHPIFAILALVIITSIIYFIFYPDTDKEYSNTTTSALKVKKSSEFLLPDFTPRNSKTRLSDTKLFKINASDKQQKLHFDDNTQIILPDSFSDKTETLSISNATIDDSVWISDHKPLKLIDISLSDNQQPDKAVEVSFKYQPDQLDSGMSAEEQLGVFRWDEKGGGWISLPVHVDSKNNQITAINNHFSLIGLFIKVYAGSYAGEKILNDTYKSSKGHFIFYYSGKAINKDPSLNSEQWKKAPKDKYTGRKNVPGYILALASILETSLERYTSKEFKNPAADSKGILGIYKNPVKIKIDSFFTNTIVGSNSSYEKIYETIHIPTSQVWQYSIAKITLAHELFHRIQAEYYGVSGMARRANLWFLEATAEYAAYNIAWPEMAASMYKGFGNNFLTFSINDRGDKRGKGVGWTEREYEYLTSIWIEYLTYYKNSLAEMISYDASDYFMPHYSLAKFLYANNKKSMGDYYRGFTHQILFSKSSPLKNFPLVSSLNSSNGLATNQRTVQLGDPKEITETFELNHIYSSQVWAVYVKSGSEKNSTGQVLIEIEEKETPGQTIDVFVLNEKQRYLSTIKPIKTFYTGDNEKHLLNVKNGDYIYLVLINSEFSGGKTKINIKDASASLTITPKKLDDAQPNHPYIFDIQADNIPETIEYVDFEWNFGDEIDGIVSIEDDNRVSNGEASLRLHHEYKPSDKQENYILSVKMKDAANGNILATAQAPVTMANQVSVLITERHVSGAPGASFNLNAKASPQGTYKFLWEISGLGEQYQSTGKQSYISPVINKVGDYKARVKLYDLQNKLLDEDQISISVVKQDNKKIARIALEINTYIHGNETFKGQHYRKWSYDLQNLRIFFNNDQWSQDGIHSKAQIISNGNTVTALHTEKGHSRSFSEKITIIFQNEKRDKLRSIEYQSEESLSDSSGYSRSIKLALDASRFTSDKHSGLLEFRYDGELNSVIQSAMYHQKEKTSDGIFESNLSKTNNQGKIYLGISIE